MTDLIHVTRLAAGIRDDLAAIDANNADSLARAIDAGTKLTEAKGLLKHGEWLPWLEENFDLSQPTASTYMRLAANQKRAFSFNSIREADAAIKAEQQQPKRKTRKPSESALKGRTAVSHDPAVVQWAREKMDGGWTRDQCVKASKANTDGWPREGDHLTNGGMTEVRAAIAALEHANGNVAPKKEKKQPKWSGKRTRELQAERRAGTASDLNKVQLEIAKTVSILESFELPDLDWEDGMNTEIASFVFEDLTVLQEWADHAMNIAVAHMGDIEKQKMIRKLRALAEDPAAAPGEVTNALAHIERLIEKKRLSA